MKIIGTSTCDMMVVAERPEAGGHPRPVRHRGRQHPAGLFRPRGRPVGGGRHFQLVRELHPAACGKKAGSHEALDARRRRRLQPGESGLLALDWNNGNRTILVDQRLTGLLVGQTLYTTPAEIYRALIEATAFGALTIINRFEEYGVKIRADRQLRRHRGEEPARDADLRGRDGPADEDLAARRRPARSARPSRRRSWPARTRITPRRRRR